MYVPRRTKPQSPRAASSRRQESKALVDLQQKSLRCPHFRFNKNIIEQTSAMCSAGLTLVQREELNGIDYIVFTIRSQIITYYVANPQHDFNNCYLNNRFSLSPYKLTSGRCNYYLCGKVC